MVALPRCTECDDYVTSPYWVDEKSKPYCDKHAAGKRKYMQVTSATLNDRVRATKERESGIGSQDAKVT